MMVEQIGPDGWERYRAIRLRSLAEDPTAFCSTLEQERTLSDKQWAERFAGSVVLIATDDGRDVGTATLKAGRTTWDLVGMWVAPDHRGCGVSEALVRTALDRARALGAEGVALDVFSDNPRAIAFYRRLGFVPVDEEGAPRHGLCRMVSGVVRGG